MAVNKVALNGEVKLDLTADTVTPETLLKGTTAHNAAGEAIVGGIIMPTYTLVVKTSPSSAITVTKGTKTFSGTADASGECTFSLPEAGTWDISATLDGHTSEGSVFLKSSYDIDLPIIVAKIFGVCWNYGNPSTALARLTAANDPNGLVNTSVTTDPSPAVGTGSGSSPFDSYMPWNGMEEYNVINNAVSYKKGGTGFSRSANDTVVYIPEFYYKIVQDSSNSKMYYYISDSQMTGFTKHPGSGRYVGKYHTIPGYYSKSGSQPLINMTRATARTQSKAKGSNWSQYDFATYSAIVLLYLVEFADWNSQRKIGRGCGSGSKVNNGGCDSMNYHTGTSASSRTTAGPVQYRNIEGLWSNVFDWVDGINMNSRSVYICTTPANFADDTTTNYTATGITLSRSNGFIKAMGYSSAAPWAMIPSANGGSETTYVPDFTSSSTGWRVLYVGGGYDSYASYGLMFFGADDASSNSGDVIGARLLFIP